MSNAGKGDTYRPVKGETYRSNYDRIFKRKLMKTKSLATDLYTLVGSDRVLRVHSPHCCIGQHCCIHNPSDHHMKEWPQNWRDDRGIMERICPHGIGHPDPDDPNPDKVHGCDGCCSKLWRGNSK